MTNPSPRIADHPIASMFVSRWSPRAFTAEPIGEAELMSILEAARWAPSSNNAQPWRFVFARRDTAFWIPFLDLLAPRNRDWARHAAALIFLASKTTMRPYGSDLDAPSPTHSLDAGTASGFMALQAYLMGWCVHGMAGFNRERALEVLGAPPHHRIEAVYAVGRQADPSALPEALRAREHPSPRLSLQAIAFEGALRG
jgi:nitroreductase